jgi:phosphoenolpyruvate synthase/pyruvate phosphate dikinase
VPPPSASLIEWLGRASGDGALLGGKGGSLDRLVKLGFRVPPGFCVTTEAFRFHGGAPNESASGARPELEVAISDAVVALVDSSAGVFESVPRFAVRSSAVGEDGTASSYAGLHETELDVPPDGVHDAVRRCWASLWSPAATAYRQRLGLPEDDVAMAVVVQALVPAQAAAVAFTRHPVTGRDEHLVITAVRGLGDAMVSGTVTPDTWVIDRMTGATLTYEPGDDRDRTSLEDDSLAELVATCLAIEARYERPVDVEAALADGQWYILQARPITTGTPVAAR